MLTRYLAAGKSTRVGPWGRSKVSTVQPVGFFIYIPMRKSTAPAKLVIPEPQNRNATMIFFVTSIAVLSFWVFSILKSLLSSDDIPGPLAARLTKFYRVWINCDGRGPIRYSELLKQYGPIVRIGPNHVIVASGDFIPEIYDFRHKFRKVRLRVCLLCSWD